MVNFSVEQKYGLELLFRGALYASKPQLRTATKFNTETASEQHLTTKQFQTNLWDPVLVSVKFCASSCREGITQWSFPSHVTPKTLHVFEYISAFSGLMLHRHIVRFWVAERKSHSSSGRTPALFKIPKYWAIWVSKLGILAAPTPTLIYPTHECLSEI